MQKHLWLKTGLRLRMSVFCSHVYPWPHTLLWRSQSVLWPLITRSLNWVQETCLLYKTLSNPRQESSLQETWDVMTILIMKECLRRSLLAWVEQVCAATNNPNQPTRGANPTFLPSSSKGSSDHQGSSPKWWQWREAGRAMSLCDCKTRTATGNQVCF